MGEQATADGLREKLAGIDFAASKLEEAVRSGALGQEAWAGAKRWLSGIRQRTVSDLARFYGSLAPGEGIDHLNGLLETEPRNARAYLARGTLRQMAGQISAAEDDYLMAAALDPKEAEPHLRLAIVHEQRGRLSRALYSYRAYLSVEPDPEGRTSAEGAARRVDAALVPVARSGPRLEIAETRARIEYLLDVLGALTSADPVEDRSLQSLIRRYSERLALLSTPSREPIADHRTTLDAPVELERPPAPVHVQDAAAAMAVQPDPRAATSPPLDSQVPPAVSRPVAVPELVAPQPQPRQPRAPINWGGMFAALLSERTLTTILAFGVLLVAISSVALLVDQWRSAPSYTDVWSRIQAILVGQFVMFLTAGHIVRERLKLRLSGLAIITLGALWVPFNIGAWMFREFVAPGDVTLPGLGLPLDLPLSAWLIVAAVTAPAWLLLTIRYRGHLLTHGTVAAAGAIVALSLAVLGLRWEWSVASLAVVAIPVLVIWHRLRGTSFNAISSPLFWTSQAILTGAAGILFGFWAVGATGSYPLAVAGLAGTCLYLLAYHYTSRRAYEYLLVGLPAISTLYALSESGIVQGRFLDLPLFGLAVMYLAAGQMLRGRYSETLLRRWQALQPAHAIGYLLLAGSAIWPEVEQMSRAAVLFGITAIAAVSARTFRQPQWTWFAASLLVVPYLLLIDLFGWVSAGYAALCLAVLGTAYLAIALILRRSHAHAAPLIVGAFALSAAATGLAISQFALGEPRIAVLTLPAVLATLGGLWGMSSSGRDEALLRILEFIRRQLAFEGDPPVLSAPLRVGAAFFAALSGLIAAFWTTMARLWMDLPEVWTGVDLMVLAASCAALGVRLHIRGRQQEASALRALGVLLAISAPLYHVAATGFDWGLIGILYAEAALAALGGFPIRHSRAVWMAAAYLPVPIALTLLLGDVEASYWPVYWALLGLVYFAVAMIMGRRAAAAPIFGFACVLELVAVAWAAVDEPGGVVLRWTLPLAGVLFGASAVIAHTQGRGDADGLARRVSALLGLEPSPELRRLGAAISFGAIAAILAVAWSSTVLVWLGISGPAHAYSLLGWAFALALLTRGLRRYAAPYGVTSLAMSGVAACGAILTVLAFPEIDQPVLVGVLYGFVALSGAFRVQLDRTEPVYVAAALLPVPFLLTLDLAGVDPLLWGTPLMALAAAYLVLSVAARSRFLPTLPLAHVGWAVSVAAVAWTAWWAAARLSGIAPDTALSLNAERLFASVALFLGSAAYGAAAYRRADRRLGHVSVWVLAAALGIVLVAAPLSLRHVGNAVAGLAFASALAGAVLAGRGGKAGDARVWEFVGVRAPGRFSEAFAGPMAWGGYGAAAIAMALASLDLIFRGGEVWPANVTYLTVAALLAIAGYLRRTPFLVALATSLFVLPYTLGIYDLLGERDALPALPSAALAFGWTGLAIAFLGVGWLIERRRPALAVAPIAIAYLLLAGAVVASLGSAERQSVVFGAIVAVAVASAVMTHRGLTAVLSDLLAVALPATPSTARRYTSSAFAWLAGLLAPLWALELLAIFTTDMPAQGLVLSLLSPAFLALAAGLGRRGLVRYSLPLLVAGHGMTLVAPVLAWSSYGYAITALTIGSVTALASIVVYARQRWGFVAHPVAATFLALTLVRAFVPLDLPREAVGLATVLLAVAYYAGSMLTPVRPRSPLAASMAGPLTGLALGVAGVVLALPGSSDAWPLSMAAFAIAAVFFGTAAFRLGAPILLYPAVGLATASYSLALALISVEPQYLGLALLPGGIVSLSAAGFLCRSSAGRPQRVAARGHRIAVTGVLRRLASMSKHRPFLIVGYGLMVTAAVFSAPYEIQRLASLILLAGAFGASMVVFRARGWLYPLLLSAHLSWASFVTLPAFGLSRAGVGLSFIPATAVVAVILGIAVARRRPTSFRNLALSTSGALVLSAVADLATSVALSALEDWSGIVMSASYAVLAAAAAQRTRIRLLPYAATAFTTSAVIFTSRLLGLDWSQSAVVWATQGLVMWWASQAARLSLWQRPLRNAGLRLSWFALAFVAVMLCLGLVDPDRFESSLTDASAVMAILGLLYVGMALTARRIWFAYLAVALLIGSWTAQAIDLEIPNAQAYAIPVGLYLLGLSYFERRRLAGGLADSAAPVAGEHRGAAGSLPALLELGAVALLIASAFWQSVIEVPSWPYAVLLATESIALVLWGAANRSRFSSLGGVVAFVANVLYQTSDLLAGTSGAVIGLTIGLVIVALIAGVERKRTQLIRIGREWTSPAGPWRW